MTFAVTAPPSSNFTISPREFIAALGQVRWRSVLMGLGVLRWRLKHRKAHGFPRQPEAARHGNQVHGSEPLAMPSSTERCEALRRPPMGVVKRGNAVWK